MTIENSLELVSLQDADTSTWTRIVKSHDQSTPFHTLAWKRAIERAFDYDSRYRLVQRDGVIVGVVPGFETGGVFGTDIVQPFCEYGYPLLEPDVESIPVLQAMANDRGRFDTRIVKEAPQSRMVGYSDAGFGGIHTGVTFRLLLDRPYEDLFEQAFETEVRRNVGLAHDAGLSVRTVSDHQGITEYYNLYLATMQRLGSPQFPRSFFHGLFDEFGTDCTVLLADLDGTAVGGVLILSQGSESVIWSSASDEAHWDRSPNHLLYSTAIERACEKRAAIDFGRTSPESGVHTFKRQFGGRERSLVSMVSPPHRVGAGSLSQYRHLESVVTQLAPLITYDWVGPRLKEWIHE
ncbi:lipid II:glycine glycyltransferase FemX [Halobacterium bonnevillei]|uniref:GNAT family N-acetyltransferase n=1 Tax=Halobacterium bonnevillei TaxID=2692200 RepID=A0A6B0SKP8_9EURY|nr:GNAT family N-acetyltransferase [Halobacterium bonnevillei]MXR19472.1 GNAT family N-acetyltransferase [Halobacterium bonnevillei]